MGERPLSNFAVYSTRPTVRIDGAEQIMLSKLLVAMSMTESEGGLSALELRLSNVASNSEGGAELAFEDERVVKLGSRIAVYTGDQSQPREIFRGVVTGLEAEFSHDAPPELTVLAEDACQAARMHRRTKTYTNTTLSDIARSIAQSLSLTPVINGFTDQIGSWVQLNESDLAFLRRLLARYDGDAQVVGDNLQVGPRDEVQRGAVELQLYSQLERVRITADLSAQITEATAAGWDAAQGKRVTATSDGAHLGPGSGRTGKAVLEEAVGARAEHIGHLAGTTDSEVKSLADSMFDQRARRFVSLQGTTEGNPNLRVGTHVTISGVSSRFDGPYYVTRACHRFDMQRGYRTDFDAESAYLGVAS